MENTNSNENNSENMMVDPNALVIPDGAQQQQPTANPNALVVPDGGVSSGFGHMSAGYGPPGHVTVGQFNVPFGQNTAGLAPPFGQATPGYHPPYVPMAPSYTVQPPVQTPVVPTTPVAPLAPVTPSVPTVPSVPSVLLHMLRGQRSLTDQTSSVGSRRCYSI